MKMLSSSWTLFNKVLLPSIYLLLVIGALFAVAGSLIRGDYISLLYPLPALIFAPLVTIFLPLKWVYEIEEGLLIRGL